MQVKVIGGGMTFVFAGLMITGVSPQFSPLVGGALVASGLAGIIGGLRG